MGVRGAPEKTGCRGHPHTPGGSFVGLQGVVVPLSAVPRLLLKLLAGRVGLSGSWWKPRHFLSVLRFVHEAEQCARDFR